MQVNPATLVRLDRSIDFARVNLVYIVFIQYHFYRFSRVFDRNAKQDEVFEHVAKPVVEK